MSFIVYKLECDNYNILPSLSDLSGVSQFKQPSPDLTIYCVFPRLALRHYFLCLRLNGCFSHMPFSAAISHPLFEVITFITIAAKYRSFSIGKFNHLTYWSTKYWCQPHFLVSNKIQSKRQHHFETNKGLIFDYALSCVAYCRLNWTVNVD